MIEPDPLPHLLLGHATANPRRIPRPLLNHRATCGFPSPAEDHMGQDLDLGAKLIRNPLATFFVQAEGNSMEGLGIFAGDILVVDRSVEAKDGAIIMCLLDGGYTIKRLVLRGRRAELHSGHPDHPPIILSQETELQIWGVVLWSITKHG
ncbi:LexA family protein [Novilysobacter arseniciresistens]|uniref:LexA family protein n=1 Tax=Novilysobacter arseniciresistens TaxID=1385522 RepID=UPI000564BBCE|nr:translesion error-prone DNA polymerase V autoproteolytic subunit [Lysobacter arseniciresistens]